MSKFIFFLFTFSVLASCDKEDILPAPGDGATAFVIGNFGGWGGGFALKLEDDRLFISDDRVGVTLEPEELLRTRWIPYGDADDLTAVAALRAEFPTDVLTPDNQRTLCEASYVDGTCPFVVMRTGRGTAAAWTDDDGSSGERGQAYLRKVGEVAHEITTD